MVAVGVKKLRYALACLLFVMPVYTVQAATVSDVYNVYSEPYSVDYPEDVIDVIQRYYDAEKYLYQYRYVADSTYDKTPLESLVEQYEDKKESLKLQLLGGYSLSLNEIYLIEEEYEETCRLISITKSKLTESKTYESQAKAPDAPTRAEFDIAKARKALIDARQQIGDIESLKVPVNGGALVDDFSDEATVYSVAGNTVVYSLFNGFVDSVTEDSVTITSGEKDIYVTYGLLNVVDVNVGDKLPQGSVIGMSSGKLSLSLRLGNKYVDVRELFGKEGINE